MLFPRACLQLSSVPLALMLSTIQFLSREGARNTCQRFDLGDERNSAAKVRDDAAMVVNLSWFALPLALLIGPAIGFAMWQWGYAGVSDSEYGGVLLVFGPLPPAALTPSARLAGRAAPSS